MMEGPSNPRQRGATRHPGVRTTLLLLVASAGSLLAAYPAAASNFDYETNTANVWAAGYTGKGSRIVTIDTGLERTVSWFRGVIGDEHCFSNTGVADDEIGLCSEGTATVKRRDTFRRRPTWSGSSVGPGAARPLPGLVNTDHGTTTAAQAVGASKRRYGFSMGPRGIAPDAEVDAYLVGTAFVAPSAGAVHTVPPADLADALMAVYMEVSRGRRVDAVNISLGVEPPGYVRVATRMDGTCDRIIREHRTDNIQTLRIARIVELIDMLTEKNVPVVVSAGNDAHRQAIEQVGFPACAKNAIAVGSIDPVTGDHSIFSPTDDKIEVLAPGENVLAPGLSGALKTVRGTSYSAPMVAGAIALYRQKYPRSSVAGIRKRLASTGVPTSFFGNGAAPRRRALRVDHFMNEVPRKLTGRYRPQCLEVGFGIEDPDRPSIKGGYVRLKCAPTQHPPHRLAVTVDGPAFTLDKEVKNPRLTNPATYGDYPAIYGPKAFITEPGEQYRVCALIYRTEEQAWPSEPTVCEDFES